MVGLRSLDESRRARSRICWTSSGLGSKLVLLGLFGLFVIAVGIAVVGAEHSMRISTTLLRLQDSTAEIRIRASFLLLAVFVVLAERLGLEAILGAFLAGAIIKLVDRDQMMTHPQFRHKLEAAGFGIFVPFFFVTTGVRFDLNALFGSARTLGMVPIFLGALLVARGIPALLYKPLATRTQTIAAALLQATSLSFLVVSGQIGVQLDLIRPATYAALVAAGLLSVLLFPPSADPVQRAVEHFKITADSIQRTGKDIPFAVLGVPRDRGGVGLGSGTMAIMQSKP